MTRVKSLITGKAITIDFASGHRDLIVQIDIDCPDCGKGSWTLPGHHLRAMRNLLNEFIDMHSTLVGEETDLEVVGRHQFGGQAAAKPENN